MIKRKILLGFTTFQCPNWRKKLDEFSKLKITEVALFLTGIKEKESAKFYDALSKSTIKKIPFVHLRSTTSEKEFKYLIKKYNTRVFNIHSAMDYPIAPWCKKHKGKIFIENTIDAFDENELRKFGGICLDVSHLENDRINNPRAYTQLTKIIKKIPIKCNHVSAIRKENFMENGKQRSDWHYLNNMSEIDYLKKYPLKYFSPYIAIELGNPPEEQIKIRGKILKIIERKNKNGPAT